MRSGLRHVALLFAVASIAIGGAGGAQGSATAGGVCRGFDRVVIGGVATCTHGGDDVTPDVAAPRGRRPQATRAATPAAPCPGNGRSGRRIRVLLGYPLNTAAPDPSSAKPVIAQAIAMVDENLDAQSPGVLGQHYRFWCRHDRRVSISTLVLPRIGGDGAYTFTEVANSLAAGGYNRRQFVYAVFVANIECCYPYGGQGSLAVDDQQDPTTNANNGAYARYSMIRFNDGYAVSSLAHVFQHETGHNLGAVQNSAPHASGGFHCFETYDVMCYNDGGSYFSGGGGLVNDCPTTMPDGQYTFDCNGDDYYNVDPAHGSYLATHWNVADSAWLTSVGKSG